MPMRITHSQNAASAKRYFELSDYLESDPNPILKGHWFGKGSALLGLEGEVDKELFDRLVENKMPFSDSLLTQRLRADRRCGTDLTFTTPKSVSVLWAATQDDDILRAVQSAAHETIGELEKVAQTRVNHARGSMSLAKTGNVVGASWLHTTARPVDGYPDPALHVHCYVINATRASDRWTAVDLSAVVKDSGLYEAVFQSKLAEQMREIGYPIEASARDFEIAGFDRDTIEKFSRRTAVIEAEAEEKGITDAFEKGQLGAKTRDKKSANEIEPNELPTKWRSLLNAEERSLIEELAAKTAGPRKEEMTAAGAIDHAISHCFERDSVVRESQLLRRATLNGIADLTYEEIRDHLATLPLIREGEDENAIVTTREILGEERGILAFAKQGKGEFAALAPEHDFKATWLSDEQKHAVSGILNSHNRVMIVRGVAGSGKTTLMRETIDAIEESGRRVTVLAPTAQAAHGVLADQEGFNADTLARFLVDEKLQSASAGGVVWIDEGALVGTRDLAKVCRIADQINCRLILSGDAKQHQPVAAGLPFKLLEERAGVTPFEIKTIRRQEDERYRQAVTELSNGHVELGLGKLDKLGFIKEISDGEQRYQTLARDYADLATPKEAPLVIAPTHAEREVVTEAIRDELKKRRVITGKRHVIETLQSKRLTEAERGDARNFTSGDVVEFVTKGKGGFKPGDRLEVGEVRDGKAFAKHSGKMVAIPLGSPKSFDVYRRVNREFSKGDVIRVTKNRKANKQSGEKRLNNGMVATITGFTKSGDLKLSNKQTLASNYQHFDHGFCQTSHSSQGRTQNHVLVAQSSLSFPATSPEQMYVSASRARKSMKIYTDQKSDLVAVAAKQRPAMNASDLAAPKALEVPASKSNPLKKQAERLRLAAASFARKQLERLRSWTMQTQQVEATR